MHAESRSHLYEPVTNGSPTGGYDSVDRLRQYQRGVLSTDGGSGNLGGGSIVTPITLPNTEKLRTYDLDDTGNWRRTSYVPEGTSSTTLELRQHNGLNEINWIRIASTITPFLYDNSGNLLDDGIRTYTWDGCTACSRLPGNQVAY